MELRNLRYFVAVAEELNFSRAAERVYLSQPALSQQIRKLEEELGVNLFRRTRRRVELTDAGAVLLEGAREALAQVDQTVRTAREVGGAQGSRLRVGYPEYVNHTPVADVLQAFRARYPEVDLEEHELFLLQHTLQQIGGLRDGSLDVGFLLLPVEDEALAMEPVLSIELVAAVPKWHPLAFRPEIEMRELEGENLIFFPKGFHPGCYDYLVSCCKRAGFVPNVLRKHEPRLHSAPATYRMVASGAGIGIVAPPLVLASRPVGVVFKPLRGPTPVLELVAAWRRHDPSKNLRSFLELIREFAPVDIRPDDSRAVQEGLAPPA